MTLGTKPCKYCGSEIILKIQRDIIRKHYCSKRCRQLGRYYSGEMSWFDVNVRAKANTPEANAKKAHHRENHPGWIPDRQTKYRQRPELNDWKQKVLDRDGRKCSICGTTVGLLVHHIKSWRNFPELRFDINNGQVLCHNCHRQTENYGSKCKYNAI
jgi:5-methylcytosine-specific restriction endonuclease McrA